MAFAILDDQNGGVEMVLFPRVFEQYGGLLDQEALLLAVREKEKGNEKTKLLATSLHTLAEAMDQQVESVRFLIPADNTGQEEIGRLRELLRQSPGPCPVTITCTSAAGARWTSLCPAPWPSGRPGTCRRQFIVFSATMPYSCGKRH